MTSQSPSPPPCPRSPSAQWQITAGSSCNLSRTAPVSGGGTRRIQTQDSPANKRGQTQASDPVLRRASCSLLSRHVPSYSSWILTTVCLGCLARSPGESGRTAPVRWDAEQKCPATTRLRPKAQPRIKYTLRLAASIQSRARRSSRIASLTTLAPYSSQSFTTFCLVYLIPDPQTGTASLAYKLSPCTGEQGQQPCHHQAQTDG